MVLADKKHDFSIVIPVYNEAETIRDVIFGLIKNIPADYSYEIIVVDNNSNDGTPGVLNGLPVRLYSETRQGKGYAVQKGIEEAKSDIIVMFDGDGEYDESKIPDMIEYIRDGYDMVVGVRSCYPYDVKLTSFIANKFILYLVRKLFHTELSDIFSGQRAFRKSAVEITAGDFRIETEITLKAVKRNIRIKEIPINYKPRVNGKKIGFRDFVKILTLVIKSSLANGVISENHRQADTEI